MTRVEAMTKSDLIAKVRDRLDGAEVSDEQIVSWLNFAAREYRVLREIGRWEEYVVREAAAMLRHGEEPER